MSRDETKSILLVEAEPILAEITAFRLELLGYRVETAASAAEAFAAVERAAPHLILVDMQLPGTPGPETIDHFRSDERTRDIPVIALSSNADLDEVQKAFRCGAMDYLVTPYDPAVLETKLEHALLARG